MAPKRTYSRRSHTILPDDSDSEMARKKPKEARRLVVAPKPQSQNPLRPHSGPISIPADDDIHMADDAADITVKRPLRPRAEPTARLTSGQAATPQPSKKGRDIFDPKVFEQVRAESMASTENAPGALYGNASNFQKWLQGRKDAKGNQPSSCKTDAPAIKRQVPLPGLLGKLTNRSSGEALSDKKKLRSPTLPTESSQPSASFLSFPRPCKRSFYSTKHTSLLDMESSTSLDILKQQTTWETLEFDTNRKDYYEEHKERSKPNTPPFPDFEERDNIGFADYLHLFQLWKQNQTNSALLRLPLPAKSLIFHHLLGNQVICLQYKTFEAGVPVFRYFCEVYPNDASCENRFQKDAPPPPPWGMTLLSGVCRQLYCETAIYPYQANVWNFTSEPRSHFPLYEFFVLSKRPRPSRAQRAVLTAIEVAELPGTNLLSYLTGLETVEVLKYVKYDEERLPGGIIDYSRLGRVERYGVIEGKNGREYKLTYTSGMD